MITFFNVGYLSLTSYNLYFAKLAYPQVMYLCTVAISVFNAIYHYYLRRMRKTAVNRIEWDVDTESFVIIRPKGLMGES